MGRSMSRRTLRSLRPIFGPASTFERAQPLTAAWVRRVPSRSTWSAETMLRQCALVLTVGLAVVGLAQAATNPDDGTAAQALLHSHTVQTRLATPSRVDPH